MINSICWVCFETLRKSQIQFEYRNWTANYAATITSNANSYMWETNLFIWKLYQELTLNVIKIYNHAVKIFILSWFLRWKHESSFLQMWLWKTTFMHLKISSGNMDSFRCWQCYWLVPTQNGTLFKWFCFLFWNQ